MPGPLALLSTAATEEEVVIDLVISRGSFAIKNGSRRSLQADDDGRVCVVGENMSTKAVTLPSEIGTSIPPRPDILPVSISVALNISVGSHAR
jgi:hypothetical protein